MFREEHFFVALTCMFIMLTSTTQSANSQGLTIKPRSAWGAKPPREVNPLRANPVPFVVIHHTYIPGFCNSSSACEEAMRQMQRFHQHDRGWLDIGYTFVIGGDGMVYEGRGWDKDGAHSPSYNDKSLGISFIGDFRTELPTPAMLDAARELIALGVRSGKIRDDYVLLGHRQVRDTECPGQALFDEISTWSHFSSTAPSNPQDFEQFLASKLHHNNSLTN